MSVEADNDAKLAANGALCSLEHQGGAGVNPVAATAGTMLFGEKLLTLEEAGALLPGSKSKSTLHRWYATGFDGVRLECRRVGRNLYTSAEALERFTARHAEARANAPELSPPPAPAPAREKARPTPAATMRAERMTDVERVLVEAGIRQAVA